MFGSNVAWSRRARGLRQSASHPRANQAGRAHACTYIKENEHEDTRTHIYTANPQALAAWWSKALGVEIGADFGVLVTLATPRELLPLQFFKPETIAEGRNRVHPPDFKTSDLDADTERLVAMGATVVQENELPQIRYTTLTDPEGNNFDLVQE